ncbi:AEC family transporter [Hydrogenophaga sp. OTU3427]|uniref:AEC family transporter n=1 Tax=Hydrogenophaga sp. OTU3427 TaxID=3043856 RepID=UPI00313B9EAD
MDSGLVSVFLTAILPVLTTFVIGFIAGHLGHFSVVNATAINRMVAYYTLPLGLFSGMMATPKIVLLAMGQQSVLLAAALVLSWVIPFLLLRFVMRRGLADSTLLALVVGTPSVLFIGLPVLEPLVGSPSTLLVVVTGLVQNFVLIPGCLYLLAVSSHQASPGSAWYVQALGVAKQPMVLAPFVAFLMVLGSIQLPDYLLQSCKLLGNATGGLALFSAGFVLQTYRLTFNATSLLPVAIHNVLIPGIAFVVLKGMEMSTEVIRQVVLTLAIPIGSITLIIAMQYKRHEREVASAVALSTAFSLLTMGALLALTH